MFKKYFLFAFLLLSLPASAAQAPALTLQARVQTFEGRMGLGLGRPFSIPTNPGTPYAGGPVQWESFLDCMCQIMESAWGGCGSTCLGSNKEENAAPGWQPIKVNYAQYGYGYLVDVAVKLEEVCKEERGLAQRIKEIETVLGDWVPGEICTLCPWWELFGQYCLLYRFAWARAVRKLVTKLEGWQKEAVALGADSLPRGKDIGLAIVVDLRQTLDRIAKGRATFPPALQGQMDTLEAIQDILNSPDIRCIVKVRRKACPSPQGEERKHFCNASNKEEEVKAAVDEGSAPLPPPPVSSPPPAVAPGAPQNPPAAAAPQGSRNQKKRKPGRKHKRWKKGKGGKGRRRHI